MPELPASPRLFGPSPRRRRASRPGPRLGLGLGLGLFAAALLACRPATGPTTDPATTAAETKRYAVEVDEETRARLAWLEAELERARVESHVAGMAIAVVRGDEVIYAHGFGVADVEANTPVTPETRFAIGSATKAFSSALVGILVDDEALDWDDPVTRWLPAFDLKIRNADEGEVVTLRDLFSHYTGFARMSLLWAGGSISRDRIFEFAARAEPVADFRDEFHYNNVTYMAAAVAAARAVDSTWEALLKSRLLDPLEMRQTHFDYASAQADPMMSKGYTWREDLEELELAPMRNIDRIGPAGSINSSVMDMTHWLRMQLADGEFAGKRVISKRSLYQTRRPLVQIAPERVDYGMGWMLRKWQDKEVVEHGGNIDGFAASVALLPEEQLGVVLLTNASMTPLQQTGYTTVFRALLTDDYLAEPNPRGEKLERFVGRYRPTLPGFDGEFFEIHQSGPRLVLEIPGQGRLPLAPPDDDDWRALEADDEVAISFEEDDTGRVHSLVLHQGEMAFEMFVEGYTPPVEVDADAIADRLGHYVSDKGLRGDVVIRDGRLTFDLYGQLPFALAPEESDGEWHFRANYEMFIVFDRAKKKSKGTKVGDVVGLTLFQKGKTMKFERGEAPALPTLDALHAARKSAERQGALAKAGVVRVDQRIEILGAGLTSDARLHFTAEGELRMDSTYGEGGEVGEGVVVLHEGRGWSRSTFQPLRALEGIERSQIELGHPRVTWGDWRGLFDEETVVRSEDPERWALRLRKAGYPPVTYHLDAKTGDVLEIEGYEISTSGVRVKVKTELSDYREIEGMRIPFRVESSNPQSGKVVATITAVEVGVTGGEPPFVDMPE